MDINIITTVYHSWTLTVPILCVKHRQHAPTPTAKFLPITVASQRLPKYRYRYKLPVSRYTMLPRPDNNHTLTVEEESGLVTSVFCQNTQFSSILMSCWWAVITVTTVGRSGTQAD